MTCVRTGRTGFRILVGAHSVSVLLSAQTSSRDFMYILLNFEWENYELVTAVADCFDFLRRVSPVYSRRYWNRLAAISVAQLSAVNCTYCLFLSGQFYMKTL